MFIVLLDYVRPLEEVDRLVDRHSAYLARNFEAGRSVASGRRVPRTGGVILARGSSIEELEAVLATDPFITEGVATSAIIEFEPNRADEAVAPLLAPGA